MILNRIRPRVLRWLGVSGSSLCPRLGRAVIPLNNIGELRKVFGWMLEPRLDDNSLHDFDYVEDVNDRRLRDAECIGTVMRNASGSVVVEIGTAEGRGTALIAENAPSAHIFTVNIPPEEIHAGRGGKLTTFAPERERIGKYYRERGFDNISQILANTATWEPDVGTIDVAFIDGCHDADFVFNDTRKVLKHMKAGGFILWHDFNPGLMQKYDWIEEVCLGVERLLAEGLIKGRIFNVRDSWVGVHRIEAGA